MSHTLPRLRGLWRDDAAARAVYSETAGIQRIVPAAVAVPADADDLVALVEWAAAGRVPLTPRGAGSSMAGGALGPGLVVDLSRLDYIGPVDREGRTVVVGAGALCEAVDVAARRVGLRFPVNPSSAAFCTVGGMAATNAAGARTLRFGPMRAWVSAIECVFADADRAWVRRDSEPPPVPALRRFAGIAARLRDDELRAPTRHPGVRKESSGFGLAEWSRSGSAVDLLVGSEGTLACFTALELRLAPVPGAVGSLLAAFESIEAAAAAAAIAAELNASACELLDRTFLEIARDGGPVPAPDSADAVLLVEIEEPDERRLAEMARALATSFGEAGALHVETALEVDRAAQLWRLRHAASPVLASMGHTIASMQVVEDGAVPPARLAAYVRGLRAAFARHRLRGVLFGHAGDGHVHANVLVDTREPAWRERVEALYDEVVDLTIALGGTLAGEHGDGRLRAAMLDRLWPPASVARMRAVKTAFDPDGILNPGVKLPGIVDGPRLGGPIKYDPALDPLPREARRVLDRVQRERAWHRLRLALLEEEARG